MVFALQIADVLDDLSGDRFLGTSFKAGPPVPKRPVKLQSPLAASTGYISLRPEDADPTADSSAIGRPEITRGDYIRQSQKHERKAVSYESTVQCDNGPDPQTISMKLHTARHNRGKYQGHECTRGTVTPLPVGEGGEELMQLTGRLGGTSKSLAVSKDAPLTAKDYPYAYAQLAVVTASSAAGATGQRQASTRTDDCKRFTAMPPECGRPDADSMARPMLVTAAQQASPNMYVNVDCCELGNCVQESKQDELYGVAESVNLTGVVESAKLQQITQRLCLEPEEESLPGARAEEEYLNSSDSVSAALYGAKREVTLQQRFLLRRNSRDVS